MKTSIALAVTGLLMFSQSAFAGWYQVTNYEGTIGERYVQVSLQTYDFGSGITVEGSLVSADDDGPIALYGTTEGADLSLCMIATPEELDAVLIQGSTTPVDTTDCPFALTKSADGFEGTLTVDGDSSPVSLQLLATLDDTGDGVVTGTVEIPFWKQTEAHSFLGTYAKTDMGICLTTLQVINRSTGAIDQELALSEDSCNAGMVMTPIYLNVETFEGDDGPLVSVNYLDNQGGYAEDYAVDAETGLLTKLAAE